MDRSHELEPRWVAQNARTSRTLMKSLTRQFLACMRETMRSRSGRPLATELNAVSKSGWSNKASTASRLDHGQNKQKHINTKRRTESWCQRLRATAYIAMYGRASCLWMCGWGQSSTIKKEVMVYRREWCNAPATSTENPHQCLHCSLIPRGSSASRYLETIGVSNLYVSQRLTI